MDHRLKMIWKSTKIVLVLAFLTDLSAAIQCFSCSVMAEIIATYDERIVVPSCYTFDGSAKFITDCPYSTMCLRTVHTMYLINGQERMTTTLGCALQKNSQHVLRDRVWKEEHTVKEIYPENCVTETENNMAAATKTHCYCRGNLCNFAIKNISTKTSWLLLLFVGTLNSFARI